MGRAIERQAYSVVDAAWPPRRRQNPSGRHAWPADRRAALTIIEPLLSAPTSPAGIEAARVLAYTDRDEEPAPGAADARAYLRQALLTGVTSLPFYLPLAIVGVPPEVFALCSALNTLYQFFIHTRLVGRLGPVEWVFNTPSHHRVHHGNDHRVHHGRDHRNRDRDGHDHHLDGDDNGRLDRGHDRYDWGRARAAGHGRHRRRRPQGVWL